VAGEAQINATRMKRAFDTPNSGLDWGRPTLHETHHSHKDGFGDGQLSFVQTIARSYLMILVE